MRGRTCIPLLIAAVLLPGARLSAGEEGRPIADLEKEFQQRQADLVDAAAKLADACKEKAAAAYTPRDPRLFEQFKYVRPYDREVLKGPLWELGLPMLDGEEMIQMLEEQLKAEKERTRRDKLVGLIGAWRIHELGWESAERRNFPVPETLPDWDCLFTAFRQHCTAKAMKPPDCLVRYAKAVEYYKHFLDLSAHRPAIEAALKRHFKEKTDSPGPHPDSITFELIPIMQYGKRTWIATLSFSRGNEARTFLVDADGAVKPAEPLACARLINARWSPVTTPQQAKALLNDVMRGWDTRATQVVDSWKDIPTEKAGTVRPVPPEVQKQIHAPELVAGGIREGKFTFRLYTYSRLGGVVMEWTLSIAVANNATEVTQLVGKPIARDVGAAEYIAALANRTEVTQLVGKVIARDVGAATYTQ